MSAPTPVRPRGDVPDGPPHPRPRRGVVALAVVAVLVAVGAGVGSQVISTFRGTAAEDRTLRTPVPRLSVTLEAGSVTLEPSPDAAVHVHTGISFGVNHPVLTATTSPDGAVLSSSCARAVPGSPSLPRIDAPGTCSADYRIAVPPAFAVRVDALSAPVRAQDLAGPVLVRVGSGRIEATGLDGDVDLGIRTAGDITATGLRSGTVRALTSVGDVRLDLARPARQVVAESSAGDVAVTVPADRAYRVEASSLDRAPTVDVPTGADGPPVRARTRIGTVTVGPR